MNDIERIAIDEDDGYIYDDDDSRLERAIRAHREASDQQKAWEQQKAIAAATIMRLQPDAKHICGDIVSQIVHRRGNPELNADIFASNLEAIEISKADLFAVVRAGTGFDAEKLPEGEANKICAALAASTTRKQGTTYVQTGMVLKRAPNEVPS